MPDNGRSPRKLLVIALALPIIALVYATTFGGRLWAALRPTVATFLGLGVTEPTASWGLMLSGSSADFYQQAPWMIIFPGVAISLAVFAFNLFGDSLRDWLDPKIKL